MSNTESGWTTVASSGWRARAAAGGAGGESSGLGRTASSAGGSWQPSGPRTFGRSEEAPRSGGGWGRASEGGFSSAARAMPAAFGGGDRGNGRLEEQRRRAAEEAARKYREEREAAEAARALAKRMDFSDAEEYPSLGSGGGPSSKSGLLRTVSEAPAVRTTPAPKHLLDFRAASERGAALAAAQEAEKAALAREQYYANYAERMEAEERAAHRSRLAKITTRCYDDGFDEYEPPEEEDTGAGTGDYISHTDMGEMPEYEDDEEDLREAGVGARAQGEFNAHLAVTRRSGDKSDW
jgi:hypothetical protein